LEKRHLQSAGPCILAYLVLCYTLARDQNREFPLHIVPRKRPPRSEANKRLAAPRPEYPVRLSLRVLAYHQPFKHIVGTCAQASIYVKQTGTPSADQVSQPLRPIKTIPKNIKITEQKRPKYDTSRRTKYPISVENITEVSRKAETAPRGAKFLA
jgi:hypothetical protein